MDMPTNGLSPSIVPYGADETVYLVIDRFGANRCADGEIKVERADLETVISELMSGQFNDPVRVIAFNTLEHWSEDVSAEVATEIQTRCDIDREPLPEHVKDFVERQTGPVRRLPFAWHDPATRHAISRRASVALTFS
jgi:hypothetical protein